MTFDASSILQAHGLRATKQRRDVLRALHALGRPVSHADVLAWIARKGCEVNLVTVYRMLETFEKQGIVHAHPSSGNVLLCSLMGEPGHHGMLSCSKCGKVKEFASRALCSIENHIARASGFSPKHHVSEIVGTCQTCS